MERFKPTIKFTGLAVTHNQCCCVYDDEPAVYNGNTGIFEPSWKAQRKGWKLVNINGKFKRLIYGLVFSG